MEPPRTSSAFATLRKFVREEPGDGPAIERCELCSVRLPPVHRHLLEISNRQVTCACDGCALRFEDVLDGRFKLIPRDPRSFSDFKLEDEVWNGLAIPIDLAFFYRSSSVDRVVAMYPSPAGATESQLPLSAWDELEKQNPMLPQMKPDVEALLVNRVGQNRLAFLAPMDTCFGLVGLIRLHWRGLSGGERVWEEIDQFFLRMEKSARLITPASVPEFLRPHSEIGHA